MKRLYRENRRILMDRVNITIVGICGLTMGSTSASRNEGWSELTSLTLTKQCIPERRVLSITINRLKPPWALHPRKPKHQTPQSKWTSCDGRHRHFEGSLHEIPFKFNGYILSIETPRAGAQPTNRGEKARLTTKLDIAGVSNSYGQVISALQ